MNLGTRHRSLTKIFRIGLLMAEKAMAGESEYYTKQLTYKQAAWEGMCIYLQQAENLCLLTREEERLGKLAIMKLQIEWRKREELPGYAYNVAYLMSMLDEDAEIAVKVWWAIYQDWTRRPYTAAGVRRLADKLKESENV